MYKPLKLVSLFLLLTALVLSGCDGSSSSSELIPEFIPQLAFGETASGRLTATIDETTQHELLFLAHTPLLQSFKANSGIKGGESYSLDCYGSTMTFEIEPQSGGSSFLFKGTMDDGSGWLNVTYTQSSKTFSFEQCLYAAVTYSGEGTSDVVVYIEGSDISIDSDGYFQGWYDVAYAQYSPAYGEEDESWELGAMNGELFRGAMNSSGDVGTGAALFSDADTDPAVGTRFYTAEVFPSGSPSSISAANLSDWVSILTSSEISSQDNDNTGYLEGFWEIFYHLDDSSDYIRISDDTINESISYNKFDTGFQVGFTSSYAGADPATRADLTSWQNVSLIIDAMEAIAE